MNSLSGIASPSTSHPEFKVPESRKRIFPTPSTDEQVFAKPAPVQKRTERAAKILSLETPRSVKRKAIETEKFPLKQNQILNPSTETQGLNELESCTRKLNQAVALRKIERHNEQWGVGPASQVPPKPALSLRTGQPLAKETLDHCARMKQAMEEFNRKKQRRLSQKEQQHILVLNAKWHVGDN